MKQKTTSSTKLEVGLRQRRTKPRPHVICRPAKDFVTFEHVGFERPFVKRFALSYRTVVCLSVTLVCCGQTLRWIKMKLGLEVELSPGHIVLPSSPKGTQPLPQFSAHVCCGQTTGWTKMPLGTEVGLGPSDIVLDGDPAPPPKKKGAQQKGKIIT